MTDRISTADLRKLLAEYLSGSPKAAIDLDRLKHDLAAEVIRLREALEKIERHYTDTGLAAMHMAAIARAALNHKEME